MFDSSWLQQSLKSDYALRSTWTYYESREIGAIVFEKISLENQEPIVQIVQTKILEH